jgi:HAD superfamily hydrolase (TIGR01549 family)
MPIRGVFFDLGGTLYSYKHVPRSHGELLTRAAERLGLADARAIKKAYGEAISALSAEYAEKSYYLHRDLFRDAFIRCADLIGAQVNDDLADWYIDAHRDSVFGCLEIKPDCIPTLTRLREMGLYQCIVSNIDDDMLDPLVQREGLHRWLDHWTSSEAAQSCKPHRVFFELCLEKSGLQAHEVLFVGDSPEHDIAGAHALGMRTALIIDEGMPPPLQAGKVTIEAHHTIRSLSELPGLLEA